VIVDAEGLDALSMSRLASELGFTTMSLYRYVDSKDELLTLLADHATGDPPPIGDEVVGWRARMTAWVEAQMVRLRVRPWVVQLPVTGPPMGPHTVKWIDQGLAELAPTGLSEREKVGVIGLIAALVRHETLVRSDIARAIHASHDSGDVNPLLESPTAFTDLLLELVDPVTMPAMAQSLTSRAWDEDDMDADFRFGMERILDGVEAFAARRAASTVDERLGD
jgi:AcrR family transcriptional regulator